MIEHMSPSAQKKIIRFAMPTSILKEVLKTSRNQGECG